MIKTLTWRLDEAAIQAIKLPEFQGDGMAVVYLVGGHTLTIPESEIAQVLGEWEEWLESEEEDNPDDDSYIDIPQEIKS